MKKLSLIGMALLVTLGAHAQFEVRPFVGGNLSNMNDNNRGENTTAKLGGQVGVSLLIGKQFHLMPGIAYFAQSTEFQRLDDPGNTFDQTINGIWIPLLVGYRFFDVDTDPFFNVRIFGGASMKFLTKTEWSDRQLNESVNWKNNAWGAILGLGLDFSFVFVDAGYDWGLSDIGSGADAVASFENFRANTFFLNAGVRLNLAK